jgi:hypothetical protein
MSYALPHIVIVCPWRVDFVVSNHNVENMSAFKALTT